MGDDFGDDGLKKAGIGILGAGASAGAATVVAVVHPVVGAAALLAAVPTLLTLCATGMLEAGKWKIERWYRAVCSDPDKTIEEIRGLLEDRATRSPYVREVVIQTVNRLLLADDCAIESLGALARDYALTQERPVDRFFRGLADLLSEVTAEEFEALKRIIAAAREHVGREDVIGIRWGRSIQGSGPQDPFVQTVIQLEDSHCDPRDAGRIAGADQVFRLLRQHALAEDRLDTGEPGGSFVFNGEERRQVEARWSSQIEIEATTVHRIHRLIA